MSTTVDMGWCPTCRERTVIDVGRPCAWCDTIVVRLRGGWKRPDLEGRINEASARAIHAKYETGVSARTLGRELYQVLGYKSAASCADGILAAFRRYDLPRRDQKAATRLASTKDGLSPRDPAERRRRRSEAGLVTTGYGAMRPRQPRCKGVKRNPPRAGQPCSRLAQVGSDYCFSHDPARRDLALAIVRRMRAHLPERNAA